MIRKGEFAISASLIIAGIKRRYLVNNVKNLGFFISSARAYDQIT